MLVKEELLRELILLLLRSLQNTEPRGWGQPCLVPTGCPPTRTAPMSVGCCVPMWWAEHRVPAHIPALLGVARHGDSPLGLLPLATYTSCRYLKVESCPGTCVNWFPSR